MDKNEYCSCVKSSSVYTENGDFGFWLYCSDCNKKIEDSFEYYEPAAHDDF
ncbi:hypothetical protein [Mesobacillus jeotgali]|uniref:hypothetical protein n=1 Tax=Mesobacillus jeotgali TaxID=129985 RepID=UPI001CFC84B3|nr:hypothetical protein [Mesobacillus jeotgali]